ncbi:MAG: phasin family protein [Bacillus sp. (in: firmicutes)]
MSLNSELKKVLLAGIGAIATTAEKSEQIVNSLISKGEITVEQGKVLNEELKRTVKEAGQKKTAEVPQQEVQSNPALIDQLDQMSEEEIALLKMKLAEMEK